MNSRTDIRRAVDLGPDLSGGGMAGARIRVALPLTIETEDLRRALEVMMSRLSAAPKPGCGGDENS